MFISISVFVAILLVLVILGYVYLPNSQFTLSFNRKTFILVVVILSALFLYLLGFGIYNLYKDHQVIKTVNVDGGPHLLNGIDGKVMIIQDTKMKAGQSYSTILFTWDSLDSNELTLVMTSENGKKQSLQEDVDQPQNVVNREIKNSLGAKDMSKIDLQFPTSGTWTVTFQQNDQTLGTISVSVNK